MSRTTRISWTVCLPLLLALVGLYGYITYIQPPLPPPALEPRPEVVDLNTETVPPWQVVKAYVAVLERHKGEIGVPISELPYPPNEIFKAISSGNLWAQNIDSTQVKRYSFSLLIELQNFIPDSEKLDPDLIWARQIAFIDDSNMRMIYPALSGWHGPTPIPIGRGMEALTEMKSYSTIPAGMTAFAAFIGFMMFRGLRLAVQHVKGRPYRKWRVATLVVFLILGLLNFGGFIGFPVWWLSQRIEEGITTSTIRFLGEEVLIPILYFLFPWTVLSTLFDLIVMRKSSALTGAVIDYHVKLDEKNAQSFSRIAVPRRNFIRT
jgi:hypothetical protein